MDALSQDQILRILDVTDRLGLHREAVRIPLGADGEGRVRLVSGGTKLEIVGPSEEFDSWLARLPEMISGLDISRLPRSS